MDDACYCVLGQLWGEYVDAVAELGINVNASGPDELPEAEQLGFNLPMSGGRFSDLEAAWREELSR